MQKVSAVVSAGWLARLLAPEVQYLRVLDGSWSMPNSNVDPTLEFKKKHIPGAEQFNINECSLPQSPLEATLPTPDFFADYVGKLGICNETHVVVYDNHPEYGMFSAPRVWWMFRVFGHNNVSVLDGGLPLWEREGNPVTSSQGPSEVQKKKFEAVLQPELFRRFEDMTGNLDKQRFQVMDARGAARFHGRVSEPRKGIKVGHIPNSINVPFTSVLHGDDSPTPRVMKSPEELKAIFEAQGLDLSQPLTASCGSGITACLLTLAAYRAGKKNVAVFDGSWEEYGQKAKPEQIVGPPPDPSAG